MTQEVKILGIIGLVTVFILIGGVFFLNRANPPVATDTSGQQVVDKKILIAESLHTKGPKNAKVTVVEFADFQCPACGAFHPLMKAILQDYDGRIFYVYRHFPLSIHKNALPAAQASEQASKQGKFWEMYALLFEYQNEWSELSNPADQFASFAKQLGIDEKLVKSAVETGQYLSIIQNDINDGNTLGVNATPTVYVNGKRVTGALSIKDLADKVRSAIDEGLKK